MYKYGSLRPGFIPERYDHSFTDIGISEIVGPLNRSVFSGNSISSSTITGHRSGEITLLGEIQAAQKPQNVASIGRINSLPS